MTAGGRDYVQPPLPGFCAECGRELPLSTRRRRGGREREYCGAACRQRAYRRRQKLAAFRRAVRAFTGGEEKPDA